MTFGRWEEVPIDQLIEHDGKATTHLPQKPRLASCIQVTPQLNTECLFQHPRDMEVRDVSVSGS
ncbi:hypothetical protein DWU98_20285 [Dyella monticola]|uniref:Uncharacterized protein n=1 Tax=Dyella monticola TaxID=1927958 RepID=A0A370WSF3_9GAMM|nr:hypothetical protein DWU98_20285 [Dyella monticola]